ncbi:hypothetical protein F5878DRAFT_646899 [Lentinula raphanica]|uniref:Uncharacterized protein n=1 Tax=Lentinula raphanica TaxID=153919 RepID=A0AA38NX86_9AGAR|nr:hypothetical protein F5878DRAFT_646899 [Lentinula raphanica]
MRWIMLVLLGLVSVTYAIPPPLPAHSEPPPYRHPPPSYDDAVASMPPSYYSGNPGSTPSLYQVSMIVEYGYMKSIDRAATRMFRSKCEPTRRSRILSMFRSTPPAHQKLKEEIGEWSRQFIEHRIFGEILGMNAQLSPSGDQVYYDHIRRLRFQIVTSDIPVAVVYRAYVVPNSFDLHSLVGHEAEPQFVHKATTPCVVELDFNDEFVVVQFKPHPNDPSHDFHFVIELGGSDRRLLQQCDELVDE